MERAGAGNLAHDHLLLSASSLGKSYQKRHVVLIDDFIVMPAATWVNKKVEEKDGTPRIHIRTRTDAPLPKVNTSKAGEFEQIVAAAVSAGRCPSDARPLVLLGEGMTICESNCVPKLKSLGITLQRR